MSKLYNNPVKKLKTLTYIIFVIFVITTSLYIRSYKNDDKPQIEGTKVIYSYDKDGDSIVFVIDGEEVECRLLAIDAPEMDTQIGKDAAAYVRGLLRNAKTIILQEDSDSVKYDRYERYLCWVWIDGELLQAKLVEQGYAKVAYLFADYQYLDWLYELQKQAQDNKIGIWNVN